MKKTYLIPFTDSAILFLCGATTPTEDGSGNTGDAPARNQKISLYC